MALSPDLMCAGLFKYPWDAKTKLPCLTGNPPQISLLYIMDTILTNQGALAEQVVDALNMVLDESNIGVG